MLLPRILTALIGIPIVLLCIYYGGIPYFIMFFAVILFAVIEFFTVCKKYKPLTVLGTLISVILYFSLYIINNQNLIATIVICSIFLIFFIAMLKNNIENISASIAITCVGSFFITWTLFHMVLIRDLQYGMQYIIFLFVNVWCLDTGAYFIGKKFGKHKLASVVSPKKTIEGAIAGVVTAIIVSVLCQKIFMQSIISIKEAIIFAIIISIVGQFSDLAESLFKRDCNIKDSGNILPGHGGMLDRFDSYLFAAPVFYYSILLLK